MMILLTVKDAAEITLRLTAATDYNISLLDFDRTIDPSELCKTILDKTDSLSFQNDLKRDIWMNIRSYLTE